MKIKKLSVLGFKSFMDKLLISFPFGISGIVGPNGCGKSNIVDAIRWCMGEQSPKQLRGRQMEDVIFSGAGEFKPLGMAEVSIVFENGDGSFPSPFTHDAELSVTRRLYRSGESEYLINNVPCRLKDIQEIFMDTGLGNKAYSIIGQGKIGVILEQKPEDTRIMLEEAAGITKYRKKVEISRRKMEATESNLQRVEDIMVEVARQMRSLKRQASKAKRYKTISEEIRRLQLTLYSNNYHQFKEESGHKVKSTEDLVQEEIAKTTEHARLQARVDTLDLELEEKDRGLSNLRQNHERLRERVHKKESTIEALASELRLQKDMEERLIQEKGDIENRLLALEDERTRLSEKVEEMKGSFVGLEGEISLKEKRSKAKRDLLKQVKEEYEDARSMLNEGVNREIGLNHESGYLNRMLGEISDTRSRLEDEMEEVKAKIEALTKVSDRKSLTREATADRLQDIIDAIDEENARHEKLENTKKQIESDLKSSEANLNIHESRLASLKALSENFEGYKVGVRTIMKAKDLEPRQKGRIIGLVADTIRVDSEYEQAVEAVLADKLQYIIVESQEDGIQAVDYLKKRARGRSSFIPLKDINKNGGGKKSDNANFRRLSDLVSAPESYKTIIEALLSDTILVNSLEEAISIWKGNGKDKSIVTIDGDMVDKRGVVSGGKLARSSQGLLARKREIGELKEKAEQFRKEVEGLQKRLNDVTMEAEDAKSATDMLTEDKWACQEELNELDQITFRLGQEMDQLEKLSRRITEDLERKDKEQGRHKEKLSEVEEKLQQCKEKRQQEEEYFQRKEIELLECEAEFEQSRDELANIKADYGVLQEEKRGLVREMERLLDYAEESRSRLEKIEEDISSGRTRRKDCIDKRDFFRESLLTLSVELEKSQEILHEVDRKRETLAQSIKEEENKSEHLRTEAEELREKINRAKMEQSEIRFKMNNLIEITKEKFNDDLLNVYETYLEDDFSSLETEEKLENQKNLRQRLGEVNLTAIKEHEALKERYQFIKEQREDLLSSIESLRKAIRKINQTSLEKFMITFAEVDKKLKEIFPILFSGGTASLQLTDETRPLESGVLVVVQPPGKKLSHMGLLSGGEKALVAMALLFAIYMIKPSPFCLLDEVDAPLDEANIDRFNSLIEEIKRFSQIIMVTHNRRTMEISDRLYGVTMEKAGVSKLVSVDLLTMKNNAPMNPLNN